MGPGWEFWVACVPRGRASRSSWHMHMAPSSWEGVAVHASDQAGEREAGRGLGRRPEVEQEYTVYKDWIAEQGLDNHRYVVKITEWEQQGGGAAVALEPNLVPYDLEPGISHWVLWHHPDSCAGSTEVRPCSTRWNCWLHQLPRCWPAFRLPSTTQSVQAKKILPLLLPPVPSARACGGAADRAAAPGAEGRTDIR